MVQYDKLPTGWLVGWRCSKKGKSTKIYTGPGGASYTTLKSAASAAGVTGRVLHPMQRPSVPPLPTVEAQRAAIVPTMREVNAARASTSVDSDQDTLTVSERLSRARKTPNRLEERSDF